MNFAQRLLIVGMLLILPAIASAQEATLTGTVTDSTGAVLPGVTVTATNEATGNTFTGVTDESGIYRVAVRVGAYRITAELQGFGTAMRSGIQLLVGQTAALNLQLSLSTVQETVTVTAEAPLLNVSTSSLGGNVDPRQVQELPVSGRNWMGLALLAPGSRTSSTNASTPLPDRNDGENREFQLNVDGQQVSADIGAGGQPRYSQDSIAEFQFLSNRFDATLGRSSGVQVNVVTKSGTNQLSGLIRGNFRDDSLNAEHPVLERVVDIRRPRRTIDWMTVIDGGTTGAGHNQPHRAVTIMATKPVVSDPISTDLKRVMRQLKLGRMLDTLPERLTFARSSTCRMRRFWNWSSPMRPAAATTAQRPDAPARPAWTRPCAWIPGTTPLRCATTAPVDRPDQPAVPRWTARRLPAGSRGSARPTWPPPSGTSPCAAVSPLMFRDDPMFKQLEGIRLDNSTEAEMRRLRPIRLLLIDDFALQPMDATATGDFYELVVARDHRASTVLTSNWSPDEWLAIMSHPLLADPPSTG